MNTEDNTDRSQRIAKNTLFLYVRMFFVLAVSLYTSRALLQALGVVDYGIYQVVGSLVTAFGFVSGAMVSSTLRFFSFELGQGNQRGVEKVFSVSLIVQFFFALLIFLLATIFGLWYIPNYLVVPPERLSVATWIFFTSLAAFCIKMIIVPFQSLIVSHERMSLYALLSIVEVLLQLVAVLVLKVVDVEKLFWYPVYLLFISLGMFLSYVLSYKSLFSQVKFFFVRDKEAYRQILSYSGWNIFGNVAAVAQTQGVNVVYNFFFGPVLNAAFGITTQVRGAIQMFASNFQMAVNPQIIKSYSSGDKEYLKSLLYSSSKLSYLLILFIAVPFVLDSNWVLRVWLRDPPAYAPSLVSLTAVVILIDVFSGPLMTGIQATGRVKLYQVVVGGLIMMILPLSVLSFCLGASPETVLYLNIFISLVCLAVRLALSKKYYELDVWGFVNQVVFRVIPPTTVVALGVFVYKRCTEQSLTIFLLSILLLWGGCALVAFFLTLSSREVVLVKSFVSYGRKR